jgi:hypothetical protein
VTFVRRRIDLTFNLGTGSFGETGATTVTVTDLRVSAHIQTAGQPSMGQLQLKVWGLTPSILNQLTALTPGAMLQRNNSILVAAGDDGSTLANVFQGTINNGWADLNGQPDSALNVTAFAGQFQKIKLAAPSSYPGSADPAVIMSNIAAAIEVPFVNAGVTGIRLATQYLPGTLWQQAQRCAEAAGIMWNSLDDGTLTIWPKGGTRGGMIPLISPDNGKFQVQSSITQAVGTWTVSNFVHDLESEVPDGDWKTDIEGFTNYDAPIPTNQ